MARGRGGQVTLTLRLIDGVSRPGRSIVGSLGSVGRAVSGFKTGTISAGARSVENFRGNIDKLGATSVAAGAGIFALGRQILASERALNKSVAAGNLSMAQRKDAYANAIKLNYEYGGSVNDVIDAQTELLRSGLDYNKSKGALPDVMNLAQATGEDTIGVSRAIVTNLTALRMEMTESARAADNFVQALDRTAGVDLIDFETSGKYFNPVASAVGMSAEEAMSYQIEMATRGIYGSSAGTGLRAMPAAVLAPTEKALGAYGRLGINPEKYRGKKTGSAGPSQILGALGASGIDTDNIPGIEETVSAIVSAKMSDSKKTQAIITQLGEELGVVTGEDRKALAVTLATAFASGSSNVDMQSFLRDLKLKGAGFADYEAIFGRYHASKFLGYDPNVQAREQNLLETSAKGGTSRKSATMMAGLPGDVNNLEGSAQAVGAAISNAGALTDFARAAQAVAASLQLLSQQNPTFLRLAFGATVALAALAPLGLIATGAGAALGLLVNPITLVGGALAALAGLNMAPISNGIRTFGNHFSRALDPSVVRRAKELFGRGQGIFSGMRMGNLSLNRIGAQMGTGLAQIVNDLAAGGPRLRAAASGFADSMKVLADGAFARVGEVLDNVSPKIKTGVDALRGLFETTVNSKISMFTDLGTALVEFGGKVGTAFGPTVAPALDLVAASFNTMGQGAQLLGTGLSTAQDAIVAFATGVLSNMDMTAMQQLGSSLSGFFDLLRGPIEALGRAFSSADGGIKGAHGSIMSFASWAGAGTGGAISDFARDAANVLNDLAAAARAVAAAWETMKASFSSKIGMPALLGGTNAPTPIGAPALTSGAPTGRMAPVPIGRPSLLGGKAAGGAVRRGPYLVGEKGPEIVHMGGNGHVTPNHRLPGGSTGPININVYETKSARHTGNEVMRQLDRAISRSGQIGLNRE